MDFLSRGQYASAWTSYPSHYKFFSIQINVSDVSEVRYRKTYEFLSFLGDVGGLFVFYRSFFNLFLASFTYTKIIARIAQRFYTWQMETEKWKDWFAKAATKKG